MKKMNTEQERLAFVRLLGKPLGTLDVGGGETRGWGGSEDFTQKGERWRVQLAPRSELGVISGRPFCVIVIVLDRLVPG